MAAGQTTPVLPSPDLENVSLADVLAALADPTRLDLVLLLAKRRDATAMCSRILETLDLAKQNFSHHAKALHAVGLIEAWYVGRNKYVRLRRDFVDKRFPGLLDGVLKAARR
ncbi:MAG TPA: helix-turn-helix domain-containing protein [Candidatus Baltobacteraceae bacterium]|jgi:DNA-binding transcriptional ArsR family regulator